MQDFAVKNPHAFMDAAVAGMVRDMRDLRHSSRNVTARSVFFRLGTLAHLANGSLERYEGELRRAALDTGLPKKELENVIRRALRDGRREPTGHYAAPEEGREIVPLLRVRRSWSDHPPEEQERVEHVDPGPDPAMARALWLAARSAEGTPAQAYLERRGIAWRLVAADVRYSRRSQYHYCMFPSRNPAGEIVGVQRVAIDERGEPWVYQDSKKRKLSIGVIGDGVFIALDGDGPPIVAEGPEDALAIAASLQEAGKADRPVWATMGSMTRTLAAGVIAFADNGPDLQKVSKAARAAGARVATAQGGIKDAAALYQAKGYMAVMEALEAALTPEPAKAPFQSWEEIDAAQIPPRDFLYGRHYIRKFASVTVAPGGLGKSSLVLAECIAMATGRPILGITPKFRYRVVYFNAEDPLDEIQRRVLAVCQHFNIPQSALVGQLFIASGREADMILSRGEMGDIVESTFEMIERFHVETPFDAIALDPLANMTESPETNDVFRRLGKRLSQLADKLNCSIELVHHTRKLNGREAEIEDSRGGGALVGAVRAGRVLNPMTTDEAIKAGLESHIDHFRIEAAGKNNLARPSMHAEWFERVSVSLPNGDHVAAIKPWRWPDAFDGVSTADALRVQRAIGGCAEPPKASVQAKNWAGLVVAETLGMDAENKGDKARISTMLKSWIASDVLRIETIFSKRDGREAPVVVAGDNRMDAV